MCYYLNEKMLVINFNIIFSQIITKLLMYMLFVWMLVYEYQIKYHFFYYVETFPCYVMWWMKNNVSNSVHYLKNRSDILKCRCKTHLVAFPCCCQT